MKDNVEKNAINILIVEDSEDDLYFIKKALSDKLYNLKSIASGVEAYNYLLDPDPVPDIVLLDYQLPGMSGIEILEKINKQENPYSFIFLTIDNAIETVVKAMKAGALDFIVKSTYLIHELPPKIEKVYEIHCDRIEKKQIEQELLIAKERAEASEHKFRLLFDTIAEGVALNEMIFNDQGEMTDYRILEVNTAFYQIADYKSRNVIGNVATELYGMSSETITSFWKSHKKNNETTYTEMQGPIGEKWFYISTTPFENNTFVTVFFDITERKKAEQLLKESEEKYRKLIETIQEGIWQIDKNSNTTYVNDKMAEILGYSIEEMIGKQLFSFMDEQGVSIATKLLEQRRKGIKEQHDFEFLHKNGKRVFLLLETYPIVDEIGNYNGALAAAMDITERKKAEQDLKESEAKFRTIFENSQDAIGISQNGINLFFNKAYLNLFGYENPQEIAGHSILEQISPKEQQRIKGYIAKRNKNEDAPTFYETIGIRKNGEEFPFEITVGTYILNNEKYTMVIIRDITKRKQSDQLIKQQNSELQKLNADKDRFIQILAHDLKNPFNSLLGFSNLLRINIHKYPIEKIEKLINIIYNTSKQTFTLLDDILLWARAQSGQLEFEPEKINLPDICSPIMESMKLMAENKNITINHTPANGISVFADKNMLSTILRNLISNAIKFTNEGGQINICVEQNSSVVTITVSDNGVGIDSETINKLFDITQKISTKGTAKESGTGIGLLLCKEFTEKHGGKIWAESELGKGSDFMFTIPLYKE